MVSKVLVPTQPADLADELRRAASHERTITLAGNSTKRLMAGPVEAADVEIATTGLCRILAYEPRDLTIGVEAGLPWQELESALAAERQMVPLDPPFAEGATVGGVVAANSSGPRRRFFGTARDMVIGMQFATLAGKLVESGGMVVKNVAGLDMAKLMIGSFGTLAAITRVNFKVVPAPEAERSFLLPFESLAEAVAGRNRILAGALEPVALDLLNPAAGASLGNAAWLLAIRAAGNEAAMARCERELSEVADGKVFEGATLDSLWRHIESFTERWVAAHPGGAVVRASCTLKEVEAVAASFDVPLVARAGTGVLYGYFEGCPAAALWMDEAAERGWKAVAEFAPEEEKYTLDLWPRPGGDLDLMKRVKGLFDPGNMLNRGRMYRHI